MKMNKIKQEDYYMDNVNKINVLKSIMCDFQEDYECDVDNPWVKTVSDNHDKAEDTIGTLNNIFRDAMYDAQNLGFVQGMRYAMNIMNMVDNGENKDKLNKLIELLESKE